MGRTLIFSLKGSDSSVKWEFYNSARGKGGQKRNKTASDVRVVHLPSGAVGSSSEGRSQLHNRKLAWKRMVESPKFKAWLAVNVSGKEAPEEKVAKDMQPTNLKIEYKVNGKWVDASKATV